VHEPAVGKKIKRGITINANEEKEGEGVQRGKWD